MEKVKRVFLFFLPSLVFLIALTSPHGDYVFVSGPPAEVGPGALPSYAAWRGGVLYLYSSPYAPWQYERAVKVELMAPVEVYVGGDCPFASPLVLKPPLGAKWVNITVPPGWEGSCFLNFTHVSGWRRAVEVRVRLVDWYPAARRAVVTLEGWGWQFVQVGGGGEVYAWERPIGRTPLVGCAAVYNKSLLLPEALRYAPVAPEVRPPPLLPSGEGQVRYGFFVRLEGRGQLYIYDAPCPSGVGEAPAPPPPNYTAYVYGLGLPTQGGYVVATYTFGASYVNTTLRKIVVANGSGYGELYAYWYSTPVGMWGGVLYYNFPTEARLTTYVSYFAPGPGAEPAAASPGVWLYDGAVRYWVAGPEAPLQRLALPRGVPVGWTGPFYVVADPTGRWGGWPAVVDVRVEELPPWG